MVVVYNGSPDSSRSFRDALAEGLASHGYRDGENLKVEAVYVQFQWDRISEILQKVIAGKPDIIVVSGSPGSLAAKKATSTIPIVMASVGDPLGLGLVTSLARPGGNVTGIGISAEAVVPKALELLREMLPGIRSFGVLSDPRMPMASLVWKPLEATANRLSIALERYDASSPEELERVLGGFSRGKPQALLVNPFPLFSAHASKIVETLSSKRIPAMLTIDRAADLGALTAFWSDLAGGWRKTATYIHRILQGAKPGDLAIELPTKYDLVINLKTAKALGIVIPQSVLLRTDRVIQ